MAPVLYNYSPRWGLCPRDDRMPAASWKDGRSARIGLRLSADGFGVCAYLWWDATGSLRWLLVLVLVTGISGSALVGQCRQLGTVEGGGFRSVARTRRDNRLQHEGAGSSQFVFQV